MEYDREHQDGESAGIFITFPLQDMQSVLLFVNPDPHLPSSVVVPTQSRVLGGGCLSIQFVPLDGGLRSLKGSECLG